MTDERYNALKEGIGEQDLSKLQKLAREALKRYDWATLKHAADILSGSCAWVVTLPKFATAADHQRVYESFQEGLAGRDPKDIVLLVSPHYLKIRLVPLPRVSAGEDLVIIEEE